MSTDGKFMSKIKATFLLDTVYISSGC